MTAPPPGWRPPPGFPPQSPYPPQGTYPPPNWPGHPHPKKKRTGLIITCGVAGTLAVGAIVILLIVYLNVHADGGEPQVSLQQDELCSTVSPQTLAKLRTT